MSDKERSIVFLIRQLNWGGAQRQIVELVKAFEKRGIKTHVLTFYTGGAFWDELKELHPSLLRSVGKKGRFDLTFVFRLRRALKELQPQVLMTYFETGNIVGAL